MSNAKFTVNFHYPPLFLPDSPLEQAHIQAQATAALLNEIIGAERDRVARKLTGGRRHD